MKVIRKIIEINEELCDGCGQCVPSCLEGAIEIIDGKAKLVKETYCDGLGTCIGDCPTGALSIIEREAEDFDEEAVEEHLKTIEKPSEEYSFDDTVSRKHTLRASSELSHWPVQIRLVPPKADFLKGADLFISSDCAAVAYPDLHRDFIKDRAVMIGCPKYDDPYEYTRRFSEIFKTANIKNITVLVMEVPCCQGFPSMVQHGMERAGKSIPMETIVINSRGEIVNREKSDTAFTTA